MRGGRGPGNVRSLFPGSGSRTVLRKRDERHCDRTHREGRSFLARGSGVYRLSSRPSGYELRARLRTGSYSLRARRVRLNGTHHGRTAVVRYVTTVFAAHRASFASFAAHWHELHWHPLYTRCTARRAAPDSTNGTGRMQPSWCTLRKSLHLAPARRSSVVARARARATGIVIAGRRIIVGVRGRRVLLQTCPSHSHRIASIYADRCIQMLALEIRRSVLRYSRRFVIAVCRNICRD